MLDICLSGMRAGKKFGFRVGREAGIKVITEETANNRFLSVHSL